MIASTRALELAVQQGRTVSLLREMGERASLFRWCLTDTNERVSKAAIKRLAEKGKIAPLQHDLCGEPIQYGAASPD